VGVGLITGTVVGVGLITEDGDDGVTRNLIRIVMITIITIAPAKTYFHEPLGSTGGEDDIYYKII
jgi:hypothetical protein